MTFTKYLSELVAGLGFEPRYTASKAVVLPLDDPAAELILATTELYHFFTPGLNCTQLSLQLQNESSSFILK